LLDLTKRGALICDEHAEPSDLSIIALELHWDDLGMDGLLEALFEIGDPFDRVELIGERRKKSPFDDKSQRKRIVRLAKRGD